MVITCDSHKVAAAFQILDVHLHVACISSWQVAAMMSCPIWKHPYFASCVPVESLTEANCRWPKSSWSTCPAPAKVNTAVNNLQAIHGLAQKPCLSTLRWRFPLHAERKFANVTCLIEGFYSLLFAPNLSYSLVSILPSVCCSWHLQVAISGSLQMRKTLLPSIIL